MIQKNRGVSIVEVLMAMLIITITSLATLSFFAYGRGSIEKQGNRRAALEIGRMRLEELMASDISDIQPPDEALRYVTCTGSPCGWNFFSTQTTETVSINGVNRPMITTLQWVNDPTTASATPDILDFGIRVWFRPGSVDDEFNRVHIRSMRTPS